MKQFFLIFCTFALDVYTALIPVSLPVLYKTPSSRRDCPLPKNLEIFYSYTLFLLFGAWLENIINHKNSFSIKYGILLPKLNINNVPLCFQLTFI